MTFQDFLEHFYAALRKGAPTGLGVPAELAGLGYERLRALVEAAPIFHLEAPPDEAAFLREVGRDALEDLKTTLPLPFDAFGIVQEDAETGHWQYRFLLRLGKDEVAADPKRLFGRENHFLLWVYSSARGVGEGEGPGEKARGADFHSSLSFQYLGGPEIGILLSPESVARFAQGLGRSPAQAQEALRTIVTGVLLEVGAISHPANYVVERTPGLSPREERQAARGEPRPAAKRSHFIVVDHERLVELNPATRAGGEAGSPGGHASPVPHARRGHWRRLAESCAKARALGKDRVFVRPTLVGERVWSEKGARDRVFLSAGELRGAEGVAP